MSCVTGFNFPAERSWRPTMLAARAAVAFAAAIFLPACSGPQSALAPAGDGAERIAVLFWWMTVGAFVIWAAVVALTAYVIYGRHAAPRSRGMQLLIIGGGAVVPTVVLAGLLFYGLGMLPGLIAPAPPGSLKIAVTGEQWWWRVRYLPPGEEPVNLANEIRLPVGEPVEFELDSPDVIHSFWIPALGGKVDMLPGRRTRLVLHPTRTGVFRGVCAEFCGSAHALMAFDVVIMSREEFAQWLAAQRQSAVEAGDGLARAGRNHFFANGCSACHAIRGTEANGHVGPDLTHVGSRLSLGAGIIRTTDDGFVRWIARTNLEKPGVHMPHFGMLPAGELRALAAYLHSLK